MIRTDPIYRTSRHSSQKLVSWFFLHFLVLLSGLTPTLALDRDARTASSPTFSPARKRPDGILVHSVRSRCQEGPTAVHVLLPNNRKNDQPCRVLYVLPVEAGTENRYGDGLAEVRKLGLHDKYQFICVQPTFSGLPWYADHPTNPRLRQEAYFVREIVPFVEKTYPVLSKPGGRLLLGFSKSGWGAFALLLRHPDLFSRAAAWDAPLAMEWPSQFGSKDIFGSPENFKGHQITTLLRRNANQLGPSKRLGLFGYGAFRADHQLAHALMDRLMIPHEYRDGPKRKHVWDSGWVAEAVDFLAGNGK